MSKLMIGLLVAIVALCGPAAMGVLATPTVDGTVGTGEYENVVTDIPDYGTDFRNTGLDMATNQFDDDDDWGYLAVTVVSPPIRTEGDPWSFLGISVFSIMFYSDIAATTPCYYLEVEMIGDYTEVELWEYTASGWDDVDLDPSDYAVAVDSALELKISKDVLDTEVIESFHSQLDGTGAWQDDQIGPGLIPEPATLLLIGAGCIGLLRRRRR